MKTLLIDCGNSRVKWSVFGAHRLGRSRALQWGAGSPGRLCDALFRQAGRVDAVLVCSVAGVAVERALRGAARRAHAPRPQFVRSGRHLAGLTNGYEEPWRLGIDRLVGAIGAWYAGNGSMGDGRRAVLVADIGTAMTLDLVDASGRHRGGAIVPGPALMVQSLLGGTAGIRRRAQGGARRSRGLYARGTAAALDAGARYASAALIQRALAEARALLGRRPRLVLTGGAAPAIAALLGRRGLALEPDLVIHGLAVLAYSH